VAAKIAYFTAGTTGAGHLARGIALARALARDGSRATFGIFAPPSTLSFARRPSFHAVPVDHVELTDPGRAQGSDLACALRDFAPDVLLVDLFWAPLCRLLPLPACEAWLLVRRTHASWLVGPPGLPFDRSGFTRILGIEPGLDVATIDETIAPVVGVNREELRPRGALYDALGISRRVPLAVIHQAGEPNEWRKLLEVRDERPVHVFTPGGLAVGATVADGVHVHDGESLFPLAEWLGDATALACGAGYNAFWEARALGHAARTTFVPFVRKIDDQHWRLRTCSEHTPRENGADVIARWLR
jgi:hypothetical protein